MTLAQQTVLLPIKMLQVLLPINNVLLMITCFCDNFFIDHKKFFSQQIHFQFFIADIFISRGDVLWQLSFYCQPPSAALSYSR